MKLMLIDNSNYPLKSETKEFFRQLGDNVTIYNYQKKLYKDHAFYNQMKDYEEEEFISDQATHDAIYISDSGDGLDYILKIPYFYNIYAHTYNPNTENNYKEFQDHYSNLQGAGAVFVNDRKLNRFSNWLDLNSYFMNRPVDTSSFKFIRNRKFMTPKLNIGFIPSSKLFEKENPRNKIVENMWACAKSNWVLHIPSGDDLDVPDKNVVRYSVVDRNSTTSLDYSQIYANSHIVINPEDWNYDGVDFSHDRYTFDAMSTGCVIIKPNQTNVNADYMFDKVHYFKMDYIDSNTLVDLLRYCDKRREKLDRMSEAGSAMVGKYYDIKKIVQNKIQIIKNNI